MTWLHSWGGLVFGWIGFAIFFTGTLAVFDDEITLWLNPAIAATARADRQAAMDLITRADARSPDYWFAMLLTERTPAMRVMWREDGVMVDRQIDTASGAVVTPVKTGGGQFFTKFHYSLHAGDSGLWIVAATSVAMLCFLVSGIIIHRRFFKDFFTFRPRAAAQRRLMDIHNMTGVLTLPFLLMIVYTGLTIKSPEYLPVSTALTTGGHVQVTLKAKPEEPAVGGPNRVSIARLMDIAQDVLGHDRIAFATLSEDGKGARRLTVSRRFDDRLNLSTDTVTLDRRTGAILDIRTVRSNAYLTQRVFAGLHFGQYGGDLIRWLYFLLGATGTVMIGAGLILFSVKRRQTRAGQPRGWGFAVAERISIVTIAGLCLATLAYLAAARFLATGADMRQSLESSVFFGAWALTAIHAGVRPINRIWPEQLTACAMLALAIVPLDLVDAFARFGAAALTQRNLRIVFDGAILLFGLSFARTAWHLHATRRAQP